jgi:hypothetical protein
MPQRTSKPHDEEQEVTITMLVVDDEPLIRQGLRAWLERVGHITVIGEANNGAEAVCAGTNTPSRCGAHGYFHAGNRWTRGHRLTARSCSPLCGGTPQSL